ncbi:hypothetical protein MHM98_03445 [Psychrobium sp. MM17-31]|uniref:hypothetical protein n=1 Tax=Psychrobium sp. MM17-31 TaxID=2917758 RepID=UPI001EF6069B|nr:hypothetical protein [Psychrobium sp. MM17-31]MCG7530414.1 hypothetical protein [Psychrobium sp. MM17-31]
MNDEEISPIKGDTSLMLAVVEFGEVKNVLEILDTPFPKAKVNFLQRKLKGHENLKNSKKWPV